MGLALTKIKPAMFSGNDKPLVVVLGATGAGKSKLSLELAQRLGGEIVNADAMQMYKGLDIITNKVTEEELQLCPHHLISFLLPKQQFTVVDFQERALRIIEEIQQRNNVPILVGGTNYYVESILFDFLITIKKSESEFVQSIEEIRKELYEHSCTELYKRLKEVDPDMASTTHPKDKRKVIRGLEVYMQTGKPMSEHLSMQRQQAGGSGIGGPLRFPRSCVLWVQCEPDVLVKRINKRVDKMMSRGLLKELSDFHHEFNRERFENGLEADYEQGIFQSIGFKEFHQYLTSASSSDSERNKLLSESVERMKVSTRQYAKYQKKWITKRIVNRPDSLPVYAVDGSEPALWEENVLTPALHILFNFYSSNLHIRSKLRGLVDENKICPTPIEKTLVPIASKELKSCEICSGLLVRSDQWEGHVKSKNHKRLFGMLRKQQQQMLEILKERESQLEGSKEMSSSSDLASPNIVDKVFPK